MTPSRTADVSGSPSRPRLRRGPVSPEIPWWMDVVALLLTGFCLLPVILWYRRGQSVRRRAALLRDIP